MWIDLFSVHNLLSQNYFPKLIYASPPDVKWLKGSQWRYFMRFHRHHCAVAQKIVRKSRGDLNRQRNLGRFLAYGDGFGADLSANRTPAKTTGVSILQHSRDVGKCIHLRWRHN